MESNHQSERWQGLQYTQCCGICAGNNNPGLDSGITFRRRHRSRSQPRSIPLLRCEESCNTHKLLTLRFMLNMRFKQ